MEGKAYAKWIRMSPYKLRRIANMVRGKAVEDALNLLHYNNTAASLPLEKAVRSAVANIINNQSSSKLTADDLFIKQLKIDGGFTMKRFRAASMGRGVRLRKRTSHISVIVAEKSHNS